ncbi:hypothetical protein V3481_005813 [Fusarium oxysporum f. sp. vasinfectum]
MASTAPGSIKVLLLTKTCGYRHDCIPTLISAFNSLPFSVSATEDSRELLSLSDYDVVALGHNTGDYLNEEEVTALLNFVENGGGVVGIHAATSGLKTNARYTKILGEVFNGHPPPQWMTLAVETPEHFINGYEPLPGPDSAPEEAHACPVKTESLPASQFPWFDEVYTFRSHPRIEGRTILLSVRGDNESAESAGFPLSWTQTVGKGRVYYTALQCVHQSSYLAWLVVIG